LAFPPTGNPLAIASSRNAVQRLDTTTWEPPATLRSPACTLARCLDFSRDGSQLAVGGERISQV
jgi:hypothetical protein